MSDGGSLINETWLLKKRVGKGTFSELVLGKNILFRGNGQQVAVKMQNDGTEAVVVKHEADVLRGLAGLPNVPAYIHHGQHKSREYLVMDLLGGEDMSSLRDRIRAASNSRLIPLPAAAYLATQMLACIRNIHERGYIHRDIKPANFVRREQESTEFSIIDFGVAKQFRDKNGQLKAKRDVAEFRGTVLYASPFAHKNQDQCPRDDLFSLVLVFLDLICGKLPWADAYRRDKDKVVAAASKTEYVEIPDNIIRWVSETVLTSEKERERLDNLARGESVDAGVEEEEEEGQEPRTPENFPYLAQQSVRKILLHLISLNYESAPEYDFIAGEFRQLMGGLDVGNPKFELKGFRWTGGRDNRLPENIERPSDLRVFQKILIARAKQLGKLVVKLMRQGGSQSSSATKSLTPKDESSSSSSSTSTQINSPAQVNFTPQMHKELFELATFWVDLGHDFLSIDDEDALNRELCDLLVGVIRDSKRFGLVDTTSDPSPDSLGQWQIPMQLDDEDFGKASKSDGTTLLTSFLALQKSTHDVEERCQRVLKRPKPISSFGTKKRTRDDD